MFLKRLRKADQVRSYSITATPTGWEVRQVQDSRVVKQTQYDDWHRVERARRAFVIEMSSLREEGWQEM